MLSSNSSGSQPAEYSGPLGTSSSSFPAPCPSKATPAMTSSVHRAVSLRGTAIRRPRAASYSIDSVATNSLSSLVSASSQNSAEYDVTSVDDLTSEPGPDYIKSNLKSYNKKLIAFMVQQGLNLNPLKLKQRKLSKSKGLLNMVLHGESHNPNIETFVTSNGQILFIPFNPYKKRRRCRHHDNHHHGEEGADNDDNEYEGNEEEEEGITDDSSSDEEAHGDNDAAATASNTYNPISKTLTTATTATELARGHHRHTVASHTFCIIIKLAKEETLNAVARASYHVDARTKWAQGITVDTKQVKYKEHYRVSKLLDWDLDMNNPDCFIPFKDYEDNDSLSLDFNTDSESSLASTMRDVVFSSTPTQDVQVFELLPRDEFPDEDSGSSKDTDTTRNLFDGMNYNNIKTFQPGYYVFLLPIVYPINTPETVLTPTGSIVHKFNVQIDKEPYQPSIQAPQMSMSTPLHHSKFDDTLYSTDQATRIRSHTPAEQESPSSPKRPHSSIKSSFLKKFSIHRQASMKSSSSKLLNGFKSHSIEPKRSFLDFGYNLPVVRLPPSDATSTLNKSVYVNKIWNDALNYELLLPRKYIQLSPVYDVNDQFLQSHTFMLQMKLIPLVKGLCLKRIKFNVVEKATYTSKDRRYEEDVGDVDRTGVKERVVTLLEIKAKDRPSRGEYPPLCSQVVSGCQNDNLLTCCYKTSAFGNEGKPNSEISRRDKDDIIITNPIKIQCPLTFTANDESKFVKTVHKNLCKGATDIADLRDSAEDIEDTNDVLSIFSVNSQSNTGLPDSSIDNCIKSSSNSQAPSTLKKVKSCSAVERNEDGNYWVSKSPTLSSVLSSKSKRTFYGLAPPSDALATFTDEEKRRIYTFFPDVTFHNVKIRHRLQVCFRISKPDPNLLVEGVPKMHHYEVIVDTPISFVSPFCVSDTLELPSYDYAVKSQNFDPPSTQQFDFSQLDRSDSSMEPRLPTFEEAVLQPGSPMMSGLSSDLNAYPGSVDLTTVVSPSPMSTLSMSPLTSRMDHGFNNLDSVVDMGSKTTVPSNFFAKQAIRRNTASTSSKLSAAAHHDGRQTGQSYGSIDSALGVNGDHNPSRSSLAYDTEDLPSYQSVIEEEMSGGLEQKMKLLKVSENTGNGSRRSSDADATATDIKASSGLNVPIGHNNIIDDNINKYDDDDNDNDTGSWSTLSSVERAHAKHVV